MGMALQSPKKLRHLQLWPSNTKWDSQCLPNCATLKCKHTCMCKGCPSRLFGGSAISMLALRFVSWKWCQTMLTSKSDLWIPSLFVGQRQGLPALAAAAGWSYFFFFFFFFLAQGWGGLGSHSTHTHLVLLSGCCRRCTYIYIDTQRTCYKQMKANGNWHMKIAT